jgi:hypothetical protein
MSVIEKAPVCRLPSRDDPGCGCKAKSEVAAPDGKVVGAAMMSGAAAVACAACCILPFTLPAVVLTSLGGIIGALDHAHIWVTRGAIGAVVCGWSWLFWQMARSRQKPMRSTVIIMLLATFLTATAASWPLIEPVAFHALEHDPEKWTPVFRKDHAQNKNIERDDDSKKSHPALGIVKKHAAARD